MDKSWRVVTHENTLGRFSVVPQPEPNLTGEQAITVFEVALAKAYQQGPDRGTRLTFKRVTDDVRCWVWNVCADNRVIMKGGALVVTDGDPSLERLIELAGFSDYVKIK